jgi:hypothetical protein
MSQPMNRYTLASVLALVGVLAVGLAAIRDGSHLADKVVFTLVLAALSVGLLAAIVLRRDGAWTGFSLFGWGYALLAFVPPINAEIAPHLLTTTPIDDLVTRLHSFRRAEPSPPALNSRFIERIGGLENVPTLSKINHSRSLLSPSEEKALDAYQDQFYNFCVQRWAAEEKEVNARRIAHALLTLLLALVGAGLGRALASRSRSDDMRSA